MLERSSIIGQFEARPISARRLAATWLPDRRVRSRARLRRPQISNGHFLAGREPFAALDLEGFPEPVGFGCALGPWGAAGSSFRTTPGVA